MQVGSQSWPNLLSEVRLRSLISYWLKTTWWGRFCLPLRGWPGPPATRCWGAAAWNSSFSLSSLSAIRHNIVQEFGISQMPAGFGFSNFTPRIFLPSLNCELWEIIETAPALVSKSLTTELGSLSPTFYMLKTFFQRVILSKRISGLVLSCLFPCGIL